MASSDSCEYVGLVHRRIVEQLERRQFAGLRRVEHRHLALLLHALALLDHRRRRFDARLGARGDALFLPTLAASTRAFLASTPTATSRATLRRALIQPMPFQMPAPILSTMVSQDTPNASDTPAIQAASMNSVAPRKLRLSASPVADELPDHAARGLAQACPAFQCRVARPQLANNMSVKPPMRTAVLTRVRPSSSSRCRNITKQATPSMIGNRICRPAEQEEQDVRQPGAERPDDIADARARRRPSKKTPGPRGGRTPAQTASPAR